MHQRGTEVSVPPVSGASPWAGHSTVEEVSYKRDSDENMIAKLSLGIIRPNTFDAETFFNRLDGVFGVRSDIFALLC
jgi:hypothetical protein